MCYYSSRGYSCRRTITIFHQISSNSMALIQTDWQYPTLSSVLMPVLTFSYHSFVPSSVRTLEEQQAYAGSLSSFQKIPLPHWLKCVGLFIIGIIFSCFWFVVSLILFLLFQFDLWVHTWLAFCGIVYPLDYINYYFKNKNKTHELSNWRRLQSSTVRQCNYAHN